MVRVRILKVIVVRISSAARNIDTFQGNPRQPGFLALLSSCQNLIILADKVDTRNDVPNLAIKEAIKLSR